MKGNKSGKNLLTSQHKTEPEAVGGSEDGLGYMGKTSNYLRNMTLLATQQKLLWEEI